MTASAAGFATNGVILERETINGDFNLTLAASGWIHRTRQPDGDRQSDARQCQRHDLVRDLIWERGPQNFGSNSPYDNTGRQAFTSPTTRTLTVGGQIIFGASIGNAIYNNNIRIISPPGPDDPPRRHHLFRRPYHDVFRRQRDRDQRRDHHHGRPRFHRKSIFPFDHSDRHIQSRPAAPDSAFQVGGTSLLGVIQNTLINNGTLQATNGASLTINDLNQTTGTVTVTSSASEAGWLAGQQRHDHGHELVGGPQRYVHAGRLGDVRTDRDRP